MVNTATRRKITPAISVLFGLVMTLTLLARTTSPKQPGRQPGRNAASTVTNDRTSGRKMQPIRDLTTEFQHHTPATREDVLVLMRRQGLAPKLISRAVKRKGSLGGQFKVPNVVHYIYFGKTTQIGFRQYISFLGVNKFIRPDYIFVHGDGQFVGAWWVRTLIDVPNIYHVRQPRPTEIHGRAIGWIQHASDFLRLQLLYDFGGIYLDNDVLVVSSFDPLRNFDFTLDREGTQALANGVIVSRRGAPFLQVWLESYRVYLPGVWVGNSVSMAYRIARILPHLIHVENKTMVHPTYKRLDLLYSMHYDWSNNYCIHLYEWRSQTFPKGPKGLKYMRGTVGEIMRYIYSARL